MASPTVWTKFSSRNKGGSIVKFRIQDLPRNHCLEEIIDFFLVHFTPEEPIHKSAGISKSTAAIAEHRKSWNDWLERSPYHIVVCYVDDDAETDVRKIIAVSATEFITETEDVKNLKIQTKEMKKFFEIVYHLDLTYDVMEKHAMDGFHEDRGLAVHRDYRGLGIAKELLKVRRMSCMDRGELMTGAWMTSIGTQIAAERDGWETLCELSYKELGRKSGVTFDEPTDICKYMAWRP